MTTPAGGDSGGITPLSVRDHRTLPASTARLWAVYRAWCATHHWDPSDLASIRSFLADVAPSTPSVTRRREQELAALEGTPRPHAQPVRDSAWRTGPDWLPLDEALQALPVHNSLHGPRARRDGVLLLLLGHLHLTKAAAATGHRPCLAHPGPRRRRPAHHHRPVHLSGLRHHPVAPRPGPRTLSRPGRRAPGAGHRRPRLPLPRPRRLGGTAPSSPRSINTAPSKPPHP